jgi:hypothetical protein
MADKNDSFEIGYGKPPKSSRFVKGQSGNPKGRPKGAKNLSTILRTVGGQRVKVTINGRIVQMSKLEASVHQLANKAAGGDLRSIRELIYWFRACAEQEQDLKPVSLLDEKERPVAESILRRLRRENLAEVSCDTTISRLTEKQKTK